MNLCIRESDYLFEDIDSVKKYYPNIPEDVFMQLIALDPTYRNNNSLGKYGKWILNLYNKGNLSEDDFSEVTALLNQFTTYRNRIQNKDLNAYKTLDDLSNILAQVVDDDSMLSDRQKLRFKKNVKAGRISIDAEEDYDVVLDTPDFIVYVPNTHEASMKLGKGTSWCTAHENPYHYNQYTDDNGKLYIVKDKKSGDRWQYSDKTNEFLDSTDNKFDIQELLKRDPKLSKFFSNFLGVDFYDFDGTWIYDGNKIPHDFKSFIKKVIIPDNITNIRKNAFFDCINLTYVEIPDSVTYIGDFAFRFCEALKSVEIPDSVESIGNYAFTGCEDLTSVTIHNGVKRIGDHAFDYCVALESVNIPDSVESIGDSAFENCKTLTSVTIPNSVESIGDSAFIYCFSLTSVEIPNSVTYMDTNVFFGCDKLTIYTNNDYIINYCLENDIAYKSLSKAKSEYIKHPLRLCIREDTCCIPSKTSYVEDGLDKNGIYYFGKKPKTPMNWKDFLQNKGRHKDMRMRESYYDLDESFDIDEELIFDSSNQDLMDEYGGFMQMDSVIDGFVNNLSDEDIDETLNLYKRIAKFLGVGDRYSDISCYMCVADWLDPIDHKALFDNFRRIYKNKNIDAYYGEFHGNKFAVDRLGTYGSFNVYALDEDTITDIIETINEEYE